MTAITPVETKTTEVDDVLKKFKLFGRYHSEKLVFVMLAYLTNAMYSSNYIFAAPEVGYRCLDENFVNNTCSANNSSQTCTGWVYNNPNSFVGEFQLACQDWKRTLVGTAHSFGYMMGLLLVGPLSDRLGRKKVLVMTGVLGGVLGLMKSFSPWYWAYIILEALESAIGDICSPVFMLSIEMVSSDRRLTYQMICNFGYTIGSLVLTIAAYFFPYWRTLLRVIYAPALLFFFYIFVMDESPRWLLSKGKKDKAIKLLEKIADKNKVKLDKTVLDKLACEDNQDSHFVEHLKKTFASKPLLKRLFVCLTWWTTSTFVSYGLMINSVSLQGNKYVNYALVSMVEAPGIVFVTYILLRFKRKVPLICCFFAAAVLCLVQPFAPTNMPWLSVTLYAAGKLMCSAYFNITYIYTTELFPTYTRNSMHALCSSIGRIGSIIAPQTPLLMQYWPGLPAMIFGGVSLLAGLVTFLVPDTDDDSLPDTVKQAEAVGIKQRECKLGGKEAVISVKACSRL